MLFGFQVRPGRSSFPVMVNRIFLGWNRPLVIEASEWLLAHREALPEWLLVVPTSHAGRRLRLTMTRRCEAMLSPKIMTPGALMQSADEQAAPAWVEQIAWMEVFAGISDLSAYPALFPHVPGDASTWASGMAGEMVNLRRKLQENGHTLKSAARALSATLEAERWNDLARLEQPMEQLLQTWGYQSRSRLLAGGISFPTGITHIVCVGTPDLPPVLQRSLETWSGQVTVLIGAPESEADGFSAFGKPLECWSEYPQAWPEGNQGSVQVVAHTRDQAQEALRLAAVSQSTPDDVALGTADANAGESIADAFTHHGWPAFHPASRTALRGIRRWLRVWVSWLQDPKLSTMMDLLGLPESEVLIGTHRASLAKTLSRLREEWMVNRPDDLRHHVAKGSGRDKTIETAHPVIRATETMEQWRAMLLRTDFIEPLERLIHTLAAESSTDPNAVVEILTWIDNASPLIRRLDRNAAFWLGLMLDSLPAPPATPPDGRVIDVQGWLELYFEAGSHLILCGMNEGMLPASVAVDPWLGESATKFLGLTSNADRVARDAFLLASMQRARLPHGRVDWICAKASDTGEPMLPSRLLLVCPSADLPARVRHLFREIEPPESKLRWQKDWNWKPLAVPVKQELRATSLKDYLSCPFRFYLKHAMGMQKIEPERVEWNPRDFGNRAHDLLEHWGRDPQARALTDTKEIHDWLSCALDRHVADWFGTRAPLAVRIQTEALRQRLLWFSEVQSVIATDGWEVIDVERKLKIDLSQSSVIMRIDRIDRHRESGQIRVIDYKTGTIANVESSHRTKISDRTVLPAHIPETCPVVHSVTKGDKSTPYRWTNLQLPLYALAIQQHDKLLATPCYFALGETRANVDLLEWSDFDSADLEAARESATWVAGQIEAGIFGPPAERITYDDLAELTAGRKVSDLFDEIPGPDPSTTPA